MISTTVIIIIITIAICVFSALLFFPPCSPDEILPQGLRNNICFTQDAKADLIVCSMCNLVDCMQTIMLLYKFV